MKSLCFAPILLFFLPFIAGAQAASSVGIDAYAGFDVRYGVPAGTDLASLVEKPTITSMKVEFFRDTGTGERRLSCYGEVHGVFDLPFSDILAVLDDSRGALSTSPRLIEAWTEEKSGNRLVFLQDVGIVFLGVKVGYLFRSEQFRDYFSPSEVGYRMRLLESLDGNLYEAYTSLYAREVLVDGRRLVYLRVLSRPGLRKPALGMDLIVRSFTPGELKGTLARAASEARKRAKGK